MDPRFTIVLPVVRTPAMLPVALDSVLAQDLADFELFVVGDGAPAETIACVQSHAARDPRVKVFPFPKGEGVGEAHRHAALERARGRHAHDGLPLAPGRLGPPAGAARRALYDARVDAADAQRTIRAVRARERGK